MAKGASRCCELANPAQVRQIASQTGVLLCRMRFVAGRGAVAKLLQAGDRRHRGLPAGALQRRAIGKTLLAGALHRRAIGKMLLAGSAMAKRMAALWQRAIGKQARKEPPRQAGKEHPVLGKQKRERQNPLSLKPALVMTALVRVTGARPRGSSQLLLCSLELLW